MKRSATEVKQWRAKMSGISKKVANMSDAERGQLASKMLVTTCEGHALSVKNNCFLIMESGRADLTIVGGFRQWQKVNRMVKKGESAAGHIFVPCGQTKDKDTGDLVADGDVYFRLVPMFDITQTQEINAPVLETVNA